MDQRQKEDEEADSEKFRPPPSYLKIPFFVGFLIIVVVFAGLYWMFFDFLKLLHLR